MKPQPALNIAFLSGLSGTGKSTLVAHFISHPLDGWLAYDFDKGEFPCPADRAEHFTWRMRQTGAWLDTAKENAEKGILTAIFGLAPYPQNILELAHEKGILASSVRFGLLHCDPEIRRQRLIDRGTPQHWQGHRPWYDEFEQAMRGTGATAFDTGKEDIEATANRVRQWLLQPGFDQHA